jgi:RNA recognition motif-containing protein
MRDDDLQALFAAHGDVDSARVIMDRASGRSKGFGFVEMSDEEAAKAAIEALNGTEVDGRNVVVNEARPREERRNRGGFNRDRGGRDGGRGGYGRNNY